MIVRDYHLDSAQYQFLSFLSTIAFIAFPESKLSSRFHESLRVALPFFIGTASNYRRHRTETIELANCPCRYGKILSMENFGTCNAVDTHCGSKDVS